MDTTNFGNEDYSVEVDITTKTAKVSFYDENSEEVQSVFDIEIEADIDDSPCGYNESTDSIRYNDRVDGWYIFNFESAKYPKIAADLNIKFPEQLVDADDVDFSGEY